MWRATFLTLAILSLGAGTATAQNRKICIGQFLDQGDCITERGNLACIGANTCVDHSYDKRYDCGIKMDEICRDICGYSACNYSKAHTGEGGHECGYEWYNIRC